MNIIDQLIKIYRSKEPWHQTKLSEVEARKYFRRILDRGLVIHTTDSNGKIVGYCEFWRINFEQFGRILCKDETFSSYKENVTDGNIAYLANVWIHEDYRQNKKIDKDIRNMFMSLNKYCDYFVGEARRKRTGLIKVFKRSQIHLKGE